MTNFQSLKLFVRLVDLGSFSKAAVDVSVGQPTATKLIAQLESDIGSRLLYRTTHGVTPTEVGRLFYDKCKLILLHVEEAEGVASLMQGEIQGSIRVSTTMDFGRRVLAPLVLNFLQAHPKVQIELLFDDHIVDLVEQGIDVAIRMGRLADSNLGARHLGINPWSVVASPDYLARRGTPTSPMEMESHDALIISTKQSDLRWHFISASGEEVSVPIKGPMRSNNKSALMAAACQGLGIAVLPRYIVYKTMQSGALVSLVPEWTLPTQQINAVYPSPRMIPAKVNGFVAWLKEQLSETWWMELAE